MKNYINMMISEHVLRMIITFFPRNCMSYAQNVVVNSSLTSQGPNDSKENTTRVVTFNRVGTPRSRYRGGFAPPNPPSICYGNCYPWKFESVDIWKVWVLGDVDKISDVVQC